jgi:GTPase SAR1 family protein
MKYGKKNQVSLNPLNYNIALIGESKIGKTTIIHEVCQKLVGENGYLFCEMGAERGADAIQGIPYINCTTWSDDYDELENTIGIATLVEDIVDNKSTDWTDLKTVVIDTYDFFIDLAEAESIRLYNKQCRERNKADEVISSVNAAWGGFGRGEKKAIELMFNLTDDLAKVGVHTIFIGHTKQRELSDAISGNSYAVLTCDMQSNYFNALKKKLHFLGVAYFDRELVATGKKKKVNGKNVDIKKISSESRKIKFRSDDFSVDSGTRFAEIIDEIPFDSDEFIKALTDAIEIEFNKSGQTITEAKKEQNKIEKAKEKKAVEAEKKAKSERELEDTIESIVEFFQDNKTNLDVVKPILKEIKNLGYDKPQSISDLNDAKKILNLCK